MCTSHIQLQQYSGHHRLLPSEASRTTVTSGRTRAVRAAGPNSILRLPKSRHVLGHSRMASVMNWNEPLDRPIHIVKHRRAAMPEPLVLTDVVDTFGGAIGSALRPSSARGRSTFSPSLMSDLRRFESETSDCDLLPVLAATVRHATPVALHVHNRDRVIGLSVFPQQQYYCADIDVCALSNEDTTRLRLMHVAPIPSTEFAERPRAPRTRIGSLQSLLWSLALYGARDELLPEIAGPARYRMAPGVPLRSLPMEAWTLAVLQQLRGEPMTLDEIVPHALLERRHATRLLNAIYLQGRLMVTRSLPIQRRPSYVRRSVR